MKLKTKLMIVLIGGPIGFLVGGLMACNVMDKAECPNMPPRPYAVTAYADGIEVNMFCATVLNGSSATRIGLNCGMQHLTENGWQADVGLDEVVFRGDLIGVKKFQCQ